MDETQRARLLTGPAIGRRSIIMGGLLLSATALIGGCKPRMSGLLTSADTHPGDYPTVQAVEEMARMLSARTGGRLGIKSYPGGQLGSETDTLEITSFGGLDFNRVNLAPLNSIEPMTLPFSLPFVFNSVDHMRRTVDGEIGEEVLASLEPHNLIGLCFYDSGARSFYNTRRPIRTPADMAGLKLRVPASDLYVRMVNALGANAVPIPYGEIYQALAQGVIDGAENNWPSFESARHYEVAGYHSLTEHLLTPEMLVMSKASWDRLDAADQAVVRRAAKDSVPIMRGLWDTRVAAAKEAIGASKVETNPVEMQPFADLMKPVWTEFITTPQQKSLVARIVALGEELG